MTSCLSLIQTENPLSDEDFPQDGTRAQSAAGRSSGRREETLLKYQEEARNHLKDLQKMEG
ncbi:MAG: hypothetical protein ACI9S8_001756 [Chlamydiales bacterium]|jgi:hypothetical protein